MSPSAISELLDVPGSSTTQRNEESGAKVVEISSSSPSHIRAWLKHNHPKHLSALDKFEIQLRLGKLSTSSTAVARSTDSALSADPNSSLKGDIFGSGRNRRYVTFRTVELLRTIVGETRWNTGGQLMMLLRGLGKELHGAGGMREPAIGNVVRRIMCCVREEVHSCATASASTLASTGGHLKDNMERMSLDDSKDQSGDHVKRGSLSATTLQLQRTLSLSSMLWANPHQVDPPKRNELRRIRSESVSSIDRQQSEHSASAPGDINFPPVFYEYNAQLRSAVMEAIQEVMSELEDLHKNINEQSTSHIHADEIILVYARSKTVELFLKAAAAKKRQFQVIVCEGAPHFGGHAMAKSLAASGITTTVINDSATFALMARVNKVILPAHAVLADGGLIAPSGSHMVALSARSQSVPVIAVSGMFKLCPFFPHDNTLNDFVSPGSVMDYTSINSGGSALENVEFINPVHDYIPPQLIDLYVTNIGAFQPSYIYRLLAEYYNSDDWESFE
uniref:Translation initiation factor eIF2B subunit beta n=1 Tax=Proboscia inermis TaxID=420281 RepID=A0A7S0CFJ0_9STRA|mmetsp:Transcript_42120/g.42702  ORF Transcript_42120/g.42702 Transcript_42120/m.42702 type:complete len:506 (+) Transcript_42120:26-1543(+)